MMHEPIATADMSREERAAVNELRSVFLGKRKLPAFDEDHFLELDRLAKVARTAATAARVAREEAANSLADLDPEPPEPPQQEEEPELQPDDLETGNTSGEDDPLPPPPLQQPAASAARAPRSAGRSTRPRGASVVYLPDEIEALANIDQAVQPNHWDVADDADGISLGITDEESFKTVMNEIHTGSRGALYGSNDKRTGQATQEGKTTPQYVTAFTKMLRSSLPPTSLRELETWRAQYVHLNQKDLAIQVVIPALFPEYTAAVKEAGITLTGKHKAVKRITSWLSGIGQGDNKPSKLSLLLDEAGRGA